MRNEDLPKELIEKLIQRFWYKARIIMKSKKVYEQFLVDAIDLSTGLLLGIPIGDYSTGEWGKTLAIPIKDIKRIDIPFLNLTPQNHGKSD